MSLPASNRTVPAGISFTRECGGSRDKSVGGDTPDAGC